MMNVALFLHIVGALAFVSGVCVAGVGFEAARRRERLAEISLLLDLTRWGVALVAAGGLLVLACGLWLVGLDDDATLLDDTLSRATNYLSAGLILAILALMVFKP
jgi:hypothetical protein